MGSPLSYFYVLKRVNFLRKALANKWFELYAIYKLVLQ